MDILAFVEQEAQRLRNRNGIGSGCANTETGLYDDELRDLMLRKIQELLDRVAALESARERDDDYQREQAERTEVA